MKYLVAIVIVFLVKLPLANKRDPNQFTISKTEMRDKIKGGWAGQVIGVAFAANSTNKINPLSAIRKGFLEDVFRNHPQDFSPLFLDAAILEIFDRKGLETPANVLAQAYANAKCGLSHGNQVGRYNILHGLKPPSSGHWTNNPHAEDADFLMQADVIGLICPALPVAASQYSDRVGHIMSSGDGYYAGLYAAILYSLSFRYKNIETLVTEALKVIPARTKFYECVTQAVSLYQEFPNDWRMAKLGILKKWSNEIKCPSSSPDDNVDARLSVAFSVLSLLYGNGDFAKTLEIAGSICPGSNAHIVTVAGILGTIKGYHKIPLAWKEGIANIETVDFKYTNTSLQEAVETSYKHAVRNIERRGGKQKSDDLVFLAQKPLAAPVERSFESHHVSEIRTINGSVEKEFTFDFEGIGFLLKGDVSSNDPHSDFAFSADVYINNRLVENVDLPVNETRKRSDILWRYQMPHGEYNVKIVLLNPSPEHKLLLTDLLVYDVTEVTLSRLPR
jgi:hypothetical protein